MSELARLIDDARAIQTIEQHLHEDVDFVSFCTALDLKQTKIRYLLQSTQRSDRCYMALREWTKAVHTIDEFIAVLVECKFKSLAQKLNYADQYEFHALHQGVSSNGSSDSSADTWDARAITATLSSNTSNATLTLPAGTNTLVGRTTISNATLTLPTVTDTLIARPTNDTLANKTLPTFGTTLTFNGNPLSTVTIQSPEMLAWLDSLPAWGSGEAVRENENERADVQEIKRQRAIIENQQKELAQLRAQQSLENVGESGKDEKKESDESSQCAVCMEKRKTHVFSPCGHFCACDACATAILSTTTKQCPMCRKPIASVLRVYN